MIKAKTHRTKMPKSEVVAVPFGHSKIHPNDTAVYIREFDKANHLHPLSYQFRGKLIGGAA